jgi:hypothetical protein
MAQPFAETGTGIGAGGCNGLQYFYKLPSQVDLEGAVFCTAAIFPEKQAHLTNLGARS